MEQVVNTKTAKIVGEPTIFVKGVVDTERALSVNGSYTEIAFVKGVGSEDHVMVKPLIGSGGAAIDLGPGKNPSWDLGGSGRLLYTVGSKLFAAMADGTERVSVPIPANLWGDDPTWVVFAPPGY